MSVSMGNLPSALILFHASENASQITDVDVFLEDGSAAYFHHNGEHIMLNLFQRRLVAPINSYSEIWEILGEGKGYIKDFPGKDEVSDEMIEVALNWLLFPNRGFHKFRHISHNHEESLRLIEKYLNIYSLNER